MSTEKAVFCVSVPEFDHVEGIEYLEHIVYIAEDLDDDSGPFDKFSDWQDAYNHAARLANKNHLELVTERLD